MVEGVASAAALTQYLPVFEPGDDVFDTGPDVLVCTVVVVADDPAGLVGQRAQGADLACGQSGQRHQVSVSLW